MAQEQVEFWFDPGCPFTWRTSRWLLDVAGQRDLAVTWRPMSLAVLNADKDIPEEYRPIIQQSVRNLRVLAAAEEHGGQEALAALYTELGTRRHYGAGGWDDQTLREAVAAAGLPESLLAAADEEKYDDVVLASHDAGQQRAGTEVGSPIISVAGGRGFFGPVVVPPPTGEDAARLYDGVKLLAAVPGFSELKGARAPF
jgi:2-hydroxychromene-2-carboxylate isomerase